MTDAKTSEASQSLEVLFGAAPEAILNELFNIVHCSAADVIDRFEEIVVEGCVHAHHDPEEILRGVEEVYADLVEQIEDNMSMFATVASEKCFSVSQSAVGEIQRCRTTLCPEITDTTELTEIQELLKQAQRNHLKAVEAQRSLGELHRLKELHQKDLEVVSGIVLDEDAQELLQEGRNLKQTFFVQRHREALPPEQRSIQVEMHRQKWGKIVGQVDLHKAVSAWPF